MMRRLIGGPLGRTPHQASVRVWHLLKRSELCAEQQLHAAAQLLLPSESDDSDSDVDVEAASTATQAQEHAQSDKREGNNRKHKKEKHKRSVQNTYLATCVPGTWEGS